MSLKKPTLLIVLYLFSLISVAQNKEKEDSVLRKLSTGLKNQQKLEAYHYLTTITEVPELRLKYATELLALSERLNNDEYRIKANNVIGVVHRYTGNLDRAFSYLFTAAELCAKNNAFDKLLADIYSEISACYTQNGDSENALLFSSKAIKILRKIKSKKLSLTLLNAGYENYLIGRYDSAMTYYNESEPLLKVRKSPRGFAYLIGNRALVYWKKGDIERAKNDLFRAIDMLRSLGDNYAMADYYNQLGSIHLEEKNYSKVIEYVSEAYVLSTTDDLKEQARDASKLLYLANEALGNYKMAVQYQKEYHSFKDSIQNVATTQRLADLRTEYEVGRKQVEIDLLVEQKKNAQVIMITGGGILLISIFFIVLVYRYYRTKARLNLQLEEQKDSLIKLNQTKDKFFSIISHDLRGPVGTLIGLVDVVKYYAKDGKKENLIEMTDNMGILVGRINKLLENLLSWSLQQSGHFPYVPEVLSIKDIFENVTNTLGNTAISKEINLESKISDDFTLLVDRNATLTILRNLIGNSIKFTKPGGNVMLMAEKDQDNKMGILKVSDNGVGISEDKLNTLFKLNEKISTPGTNGETGIGLGLQLVFDFVKLNKGQISVESEVDKGTTFIVSLPLAEASE